MDKFEDAIKDFVKKKATNLHDKDGNEIVDYVPTFKKKVMVYTLNRAAEIRRKQEKVNNAQPRRAVIGPDGTRYKNMSEAGRKSGYTYWQLKRLCQEESEGWRYE